MPRSAKPVNFNLTEKWANFNFLEKNMNTKLLMSLFLGVKASLFLPIAAFAVIPESIAYQSPRSPSIQVEVVDVNQSSKPTLVADRNSDDRRNNDNRRNNDKRRNNDRDHDQVKDHDNRRTSGNTHHRVIRSIPVQVIPIRVIQIRR